MNINQGPFLFFFLTNAVEKHFGLGRFYYSTKNFILKNQYAIIVVYQNFDLQEIT